MLDEHQVTYRYREYTEEPLDREELGRVLAALGVNPRDVLRTRDPAYRELGLGGDESDAELIEAMVSRPTLLQRPIGWLGSRAVVGRPIETLLELVATAGE